MVEGVVLLFLFTVFFTVKDWLPEAFQRRRLYQAQTKLGQLSTPRVEKLRQTSELP